MPKVWDSSRRREEEKQVKKAMHIAADIDKLNMKQGQLERTVEIMESEFVECIRLAEDKNDMAYVHKGLG